MQQFEEINLNDNMIEKFFDLPITFPMQTISILLAKNSFTLFPQKLLDMALLV